MEKIRELEIKERKLVATLGVMQAFRGSRPEGNPFPSEAVVKEVVAEHLNSVPKSYDHKDILVNYAAELLGAYGSVPADEKSYELKNDLFKKIRDMLVFVEIDILKIPRYYLPKSVHVAATELKKASASVRILVGRRAMSSTRR